jgi:uncharacterized membrane protein (UPF0127 family)
VGALLLALVAHAHGSPEEPITVDLQIGGETFHLEVAADHESRARGLSKRATIPPDGGMVFLYRDARELGYWMIDCLTDMDGIYLDPDGRITALHEMKREPPRRAGESQGAYERRLPRYTSGGPSPVAIELAPGTARRLGLRRGDRLDLDMGALRSLAMGIETFRMLERIAGKRQAFGENAWSALVEAARGAERVLDDDGPDEGTWTTDRLEALEAREIPITARRALDTPFIVRGLPRPWPDIFAGEDDVTALGALGGAETARLVQAIEAADGEAAHDAFAGALGLAEVLCRQANLTDRVTALGIEAAALRAVRSALEADRVGGDLASELLIPLLALRPLPIERAIRGEELRLEAATDLVFDPSGLPRPLEPEAWTGRAASGEVRGSTLADHLQRSLDLAPSHRAILGRPLPAAPILPVRTQVSETERFFRTWATQAGRPPAVRRTDASEAADRAEQLGLGAGPLARLMPVIAVTVEASDRVALERAAITLMLALEMHRAELGRYPATLRDLQPKVLVLYSTGADRRDDGGVEDPADPARALDRATAKGLDLILFERAAPGIVPP